MFADWTAEQLVKLTGLPLKGANLAKDRLSTEPILWEDSEEKLEEFRRELQKEGIRALLGGQFVHLMGENDKAEGMKVALSYYKELEPDVEWVTVALGDGDNDVKMLEEADRAVVIPREDGVKIQAKNDKLIVAERIAAAGWADSITKILKEEF